MIEKNTGGIEACLAAGAERPKCPSAESCLLLDIPLELIDPSPFQQGLARGTPETDATLSELADSIRADGLAEPMIVRPKAGGRFELVAGHRRLAACKLAGLSTGACIARGYDDAQAEDLHLVENLQRKDLTALEEGHSVDRMLAKGRTHEDVARATGKSVRWVYRRAGIARLVKGWHGVALAHGLSAAFLERLGRLPAAVQNEVLEAMSGEEGLFDRGGDVGVLNEEVEVALRKLSSAPWAHIPGDPAKCAGCPDRSDAQPELFDDMANDPRCLNKACWGKKVDAFVAQLVKQARASHGKVIEAKGNAAYMYREKPDAAYSVPVVITEGTSRGKVMWAPSKETEAADGAAPEAPKAKKGPTKKDLEKAEYVKAVSACIAAAAVPDWGDGEASIPDDALAALACGLGVNLYAVHSGYCKSNMHRALAVLEKIGEKELSAQTALWLAVKPGLLRALEADVREAVELEPLARRLKDALLIPDAMLRR